MKPYPLVLIGGPTGSGKSSTSLSLLRKWRKKGIESEILCADSITVYRGFDIGSAKPSKEEQSEFPHHLLDLRDGNEPFTAGDFLELADPLVQKLLAEGKVPVIVGGTGFYVRALLRGMASGDEDSAQSQKIKEALEERGKREGWETLYRELERKDPGALEKIHLNDHYRIVRALQFLTIHQTLWSTQNKLARQTPPRYSHLYAYLSPSKEQLKERIEKRSRFMIENGLVEETQKLLKEISPQSKPMQSIGYKEASLFLEGKISQADLVPAIVQSTQRLAKQQMTWYRGEELAQAIHFPFEENLEKFLSVLLVP